MADGEGWAQPARPAPAKDAATRAAEEAPGPHADRDLSLGRLFGQAMRVVIDIWIVSFAGVIAILAFFLVSRVNPYEAGFFVQPITRESNYITLSDGLDDWRVFALKYLQVDIALYCFNTPAFLFFINADRRQVAVVLLCFATGCVLRVVLRHLDETLTFLFPFALAAVGIAVTCGQTLMKLYAGQIACFLFGNALILFLNSSTYDDSDLRRFLYACVLFPVFRELGYMIARQNGRWLDQVADEQGIYVHSGAHRRWIVVFSFLWFQTSFACVPRLFFSRLDSTEFLVAAVLVQAVSELALRTTLPVRDEMLARLIAKIRHDVNPEELMERRIAARRRLDCEIGLCEMISEHVSIVAVPLLVILHADRRLYFPLTYYQSLDDPFLGRVEYGYVLASMLFQLVTELIVDALASAVEIYRGQQLWKTWKSRPRFAFLMVLVGACIFTCAAITAFVTMPDDFSACRERNVCCCEGNGLRPGGYLSDYCRFFRFSASDGRPPPGSC